MEQLNKAIPRSRFWRSGSTGDLDTREMESPMPYTQSTQTNPPHVTTWTCETCGFPIADSQGVVGIPFANLSAGTDLHWRPLHIACIDPDVEVYGIDVADLRTARGVARWTCHLMGKSWFQESTWAGVLSHIAEPREVMP